MSKFILIGLAGLAMFATACGSAPAAQVDPAVVVRQFLTTEDKAAKLALLTDDAVIDGQGLCQKSPCVGKDVIGKELDRQATENTKHVSVDIQVSGSSVTARVGHQNAMTDAAGIQRFILVLTFTLRDGKISHITRNLDTTDPQTATFIKFQQAHASAPASQ